MAETEGGTKLNSDQRRQAPPLLGGELLASKTKHPSHPDELV
jgi:hypothetical protein